MFSLQPEVSVATLLQTSKLIPQPGVLALQFCNFSQQCIIICLQLQITIRQLLQAEVLFTQIVDLSPQALQAPKLLLKLGNFGLQLLDQSVLLHPQIAKLLSISSILLSQSTTQVPDLLFQACDLCLQLGDPTLCCLCVCSIFPLKFFHPCLQNIALLKQVRSGSAQFAQSNFNTRHDGVEFLILNAGLAELMAEAEQPMGGILHLILKLAAAGHQRPVLCLKRVVQRCLADDNRCRRWDRFHHTRGHYLARRQGCYHLLTCRWQHRDWVASGVRIPGTWTALPSDDVSPIVFAIHHTICGIQGPGGIQGASRVA
mmetsp:Transcript_77351/g.129805  ORF Transcript_77351/g.129805 Transcript_77351/m.129805 type:complete len:315 (-) Transcript_77351:167-1111(-)